MVPYLNLEVFIGTGVAVALAACAGASGWVESVLVGRGTRDADFAHLKQLGLRSSHLIRRILRTISLGHE